MFNFRKKDKFPKYIFPDGTFVLGSNADAIKHITELFTERDNLKDICSKLETELATINPVIESKMLEPAVSTNCQDCDFCVRSKWSGKILGCNKDSVCADFKPKQKEKKND